VLSGGEFCGFGLGGKSHVDLLSALFSLLMVYTCLIFFKIMKLKMSSKKVPLECWSVFMCAPVSTEGISTGSDCIQTCIHFCSNISTIFRYSAVYREQPR
jgi:hypothetical protein